MDYHFPPDAATDPNLPHDSLVTHIIGICSAMLVLVTLVVGARFWVRFKFVKGRAGADDWCILVAWVLAVAFDLDPINQTKFGLGRHIYDLPPKTDFSASLELFYFGEILYYICVAVTKIAILTLYLRLAVQKTFRKIIWGCMMFVVLSATASVVASTFQCRPIHKAWDAAGKVPGSCFNVNALFFANAGLDIFQDAVIYVMPMRMLYQIQIPMRQKIALMGVFAVGGFVVITGMVRLNFLKVAQDTPDPSYNNYGSAVWSSIHCNIGVVCASLPMFKALIDRFFPSLMGYKRHHPGRNHRLERSGTSGGKRSHVRTVSQSDFELEHGTAWKDSYPRTYDGGNGHGCSATVDAQAAFHAVGSSERLRSEQQAGQVRDGGIWKSTTMVVSRGGV